MSWFKVDDRFHDHRKTRAVRRSSKGKRRDAAPFGLWVLAGSWCGQNGTSGFIPLEVLEDWDDDAEDLADRLVAAGLWWRTEQDGEPGYGFNDWSDMNPAEVPPTPSQSGGFGNHVRWHENRGKKVEDCEFCNPSIGSDRPDIAPMIAPNRPDDRGDDRPESGGDIAPNPILSDRVSLPSRPDPTRPDPTVAAITPHDDDAKPRRAHQLPDGWKPRKSDVETLAAEHPGFDTHAEHIRFADYWKATGKPMKDWSACWRNWMRRAATESRTQPRLRAVSGGVDWDAALARAEARDRNQP